jgi:hypothetical protein
MILSVLIVAVVQINTRAQSQSPLSKLLEALASSDQRELTEKYIVYLLEKGALIDPSDEGSEALNDVLRKQMTNNKRLRWTIPKNAVLHGDTALVQLLLGGQVKIMPYVLNPRQLERLAREEEKAHKKHQKEQSASSPSSQGRMSIVGDSNDGEDGDENDERAAGSGAVGAGGSGLARGTSGSTAATVQRPLPQSALSNEMKMERGKKSPARLNECLLHIAIDCSPPKLEIVKMLLEYDPSDEDVERQLLQDEKDQHTYVPHCQTAGILA